MKTTLMLLIAVALTRVPAQARKHGYQIARILSMNSVPCGTQVRRHKRIESLLCHEYVLRSGNIDYHIQQRLGNNAELLPLGVQAEFRIEKDRMFVRVPLGEGKEHQFMVVSEAANNSPESAPPR